MSFFSDLTSIIGGVYADLGVPVSTVTRTVKGTPTREQRIREEVPVMTATFTVHATLDVETRTRQDGTIYTVTSALLDAAVEIGDKITIGGTDYTVESVTKYDPAGVGSIYWEAVLT